LQRLIGIEAGVELALQLGNLLTLSWQPRFNGTLLRELGKLVIYTDFKITEAVMTLLHFVMGGYLSTEFLLATGTRNLLLNGSGPWRELLRRPPGFDPAVDPTLLMAIEEMRRYETPLGVIDRYAGDDGKTPGRPGVLFNGQFIPQGARLLGMLGSANRDTTVFGANAGDFEIGRHPTGAHVALGYGTRDCIGTPLQKLVAPVALAALIQRRPNLRLLSSAEPPWFSDPYFRSFERLMVGDH
jgi:cytochrome P450